MVRNLFMTIVAVLMFTSLVFSQSGKISGKVIDRETGDALPGANVTVVGTTLGAASDVHGEFVILSVPTGGYSLKASFIGYQDVTIDNIRVNSGLTTQLNFELPSEALEVSEISIVAERPLVNKNATNAVRIQGYDDMKNLPVRGIEAAVALQPGVVTFSNQIYIRGGRENDVGYYLEGANVRDRDGGELANAGGSNPVGVIPEALEEFQVQAGGFTAEFGGANAGIIQQTLKTGGPEYGFTFQYETDDLSKQGHQFLDTYSYGYNDFTATFSGPVPGTNNRLRFFVAGQRRTLDDYIQRFNRGYSVQHVDEEEFLTMSQAEREAAIAQFRFPIILTSDRDSTLEAKLQDIGLSMPAGNVPGADRQEWIGNGTLVYDAKPFIFRLGASMNWRKQDEVIAGFNRMLFNQDRIEQEEYSSALFNFKATHLLSARSFYEVNLNYFDRREFQYDPLFGNNFWALWDSIANAEEGIQFTGRTESWVGGSSQRMDIYGFDFDAPGSPWQNNTIKSKRNYIGGNFNFTTQLPQHEIKFGASYERWTARNFQISSNVALNYLNGVMAQPDVLRKALAGDYQSLRTLGSIADNIQYVYGYDVLGNETDTGGVDGVRNPVYFSAYAQDKFEAQDVVLNLGVRLDYIDNDQFEFKDPANPPWDRDNFGLFEDELVKSDPNIEISPRLGLAFPVTDHTVFHMQYGRFVQSPRLTDMYVGSKQFNDIFDGSNSFRTNLNGIGLNPEITTQYEIGFNQQFSDNAAFDITTFYKNIKDQIQVARVIADATSAAADYNLLRNLDFATTAGIELSLSLRRTARVAAQLNYTISRALGTGSIATSAISGVEQSSEVPATIAALDFNREHTGSFNIDYRFGKGDGGPILEQLGANLLFTFQSGHPFTLAEGDFGQQDDEDGGELNDPRSRFPLENVNASRTPWNFQFDLRLDKAVSLGKFNTVFYVYIQNLLNRENVINVYQRTGNAYNDGFLNNFELSNSVVAGQEALHPGFGAAAYEALYRVVNLSGQGNNFRKNLESIAAGSTGVGGGELLGVPRQIRFGARFEL